MAICFLGIPIATLQNLNTRSTTTLASLMKATSHKNLGAASLVSYVVLWNPQGGHAPAACLCTDEEPSVEVPFLAEFFIYTQDLLPPASVPESLNPPNGQVVEGFYAQGRVSYQFNGSLWLEKTATAALYDVCGGHVVGRYSKRRRPDIFGSSLSWHIFGQLHGFWLSGQNFVNPVSISEGDVPWALFNITSSSGNT